MNWFIDQERPNTCQ